MQNLCIELNLSPTSLSIKSNQTMARYFSNEYMEISEKMTKTNYSKKCQECSSLLCEWPRKARTCLFKLPHIYEHICDEGQNLLHKYTVRNHVQQLQVDDRRHIRSKRTNFDHFKYFKRGRDTCFVCVEWGGGHIAVGRVRRRGLKPSGPKTLTTYLEPFV